MKECNSCANNAHSVSKVIETLLSRRRRYLMNLRRLRPRLSHLLRLIRLTTAANFTHDINSLFILV